jgi:HSP20 family protein
MFSLKPWRKERTGSTSLATRPESELSPFRTALDVWFDRVFGRWPEVFEANWPMVYGLGIEETDEAVIVRAEAPGFEPGDFDIEVRGDMLKIAAKHEVKAAGKEEPTVERRLERMVTLPAGVVVEKVEATYRHGVLELRLPKIEPIKARKIEVKVE